MVAEAAEQHWSLSDLYTCVQLGSVPDVAPVLPDGAPIQLFLRGLNCSQCLYNRLLLQYQYFTSNRKEIHVGLNDRPVKKIKS